MLISPPGYAVIASFFDDVSCATSVNASCPILAPRKLSTILASGEPRSRLQLWARWRLNKRRECTALVALVGRWTRIRLLLLSQEGEDADGRVKREAEAGLRPCYDASCWKLEATPMPSLVQKTQPFFNVGT